MISRRNFVIASSLSTTMLGLAPSKIWATTSKVFPRPADRPPEGAYIRSLGEIPVQETLELPEWTKSPRGFAAMEAKTPMSVRGISLGGFGAGSFQINQNGTFGPWSFGSHEIRILPQAALHVRVQGADGKSKVKTLATDGPLGKLPQAWPQIQPGQASYAAMYPFGWIDYEDLIADIGLRFWSPIVAGEDRRTSMPIGYFDVDVSNPTDAPLDVSVMFTFPNAPIHVEGSGRENWMTQKPMHVPSSTRKGLVSRHEKAGKVEGITLSASDPANSIDARDTAWTVAAQPQGGQKVSWVSSWNGGGDGADIAQAFAATGILPDRALDASASAGAVAVSVRLKPGERTTIPFIIAWDIPREVYEVTPKPAQPATPFGPAQGPIKGGRTVWMKRYTEFLGARIDSKNNYIAGSYKPGQSFRIAAEGLRDRENALTAVERWWAPIATNDKYPAWLRGAALNQTSYLAFGHSFWAAGLESDTVGSKGGRRIGAATPGTRLFFVDTGAEGSDETTMNGDVAPYAYLVTNLLFPSIERDIIRSYGELLHRPDVHQLHNLGKTDGGSPFIEWGGGEANYHIDRSILFGVRWWKYVEAHHDESMFRWLYPAFVTTWHEHKANFFRAGSDLPFDPPHQANTHDMLTVHGHGVYNSALWILFDELMIKATEKAIKFGMPEASPGFINELNRDAARARTEFEAVLWHEKHGYYRFDTGGMSKYSEGLFADALYGQHLAGQLKLPDIVRLDRLQSHLNAVNRILVNPFRGQNGLPVGAANLTDGTGKIYGGLNIGTGFLGEAAEGRESWPGVGYPLAALMIATGRRLSDATLIKAGTDLGEGIASVIWKRPDIGLAFQAPEAWAIEDPKIHRNQSYLRPLSVWDLADIVAPVRPAKPPRR